LVRVAIHHLGAPVAGPKRKRW